MPPVRGGRIYVEFSNGVEVEFTDLDHLKDHAAASLVDASILRGWLLQQWVTRDPELADVRLIEGRIVEFDLADPDVVKVTERTRDPLPGDGGVRG